MEQRGTGCWEKKATEGLMGLGTSRQARPPRALPTASYPEARCALAALLRGSQDPWLPLPNPDPVPTSQDPGQPCFGSHCPSSGIKRRQEGSSSSRSMMGAGRSDSGGEGVARSPRTPRVIPLFWLGLRNGPRSFLLMDAGERPSGVKRDLGPFTMGVRWVGAAWSRAQATALHTRSHKQPRLRSLRPGAHSTGVETMVAPSPGQGAPLLPLTLAFSAQEGACWKCSVWPRPRKEGVGRCRRIQPGILVCPPGYRPLLAREPFPTWP